MHHLMNGSLIFELPRETVRTLKLKKYILEGVSTYYIPLYLLKYLNNMVCNKWLNKVWLPQAQIKLLPISLVCW